MELTARKKLLDDKYDDAAANRQQAIGESLELSFDREALEREEEVHRLISRRVFTMKTELNAPSRQELWEEANLPKEPVEDRPIKECLFIGLAGLLLPFGLVVVWGPDPTVIIDQRPR